MNVHVPIKFRSNEKNEGGSCFNIFLKLIKIFLKLYNHLTKTKICEDFL